MNCISIISAGAVVDAVSGCLATVLVLSAVVVDWSVVVSSAEPQENKKRLAAKVVDKNLAGFMLIYLNIRNKKSIEYGEVIHRARLIISRAAAQI